MRTRRPYLGSSPPTIHHWYQLSLLDVYVHELIFAKIRVHINLFKEQGTRVYSMKQTENGDIKRKAGKVQRKTSWGIQ